MPTPQDDVLLSVGKISVLCIMTTRLPSPPFFLFFLYPILSLRPGFQQLRVTPYHPLSRLALSKYSVERKKTERLPRGCSESAACSIVIHRT